MENDGLHRLDLLCFDERTETWFIDTREARRLTLTRQTLDGLVHLYNSVHTGSPLLLGDRRSYRRLEENNQKLSETIRDLYLYIDRRNRKGPRRVAARLIHGLLALLRRKG